MPFPKTNCAILPDFDTIRVRKVAWQRSAKDNLVELEGVVTQWTQGYRLLAIPRSTSFFIHFKTCSNKLNVQTHFKTCSSAVMNFLKVWGGTALLSSYVYARVRLERQDFCMEASIILDRIQKRTGSNGTAFVCGRSR